MHSYVCHNCIIFVRIYNNIFNLWFGYDQLSCLYFIFSLLHQHHREVFTLVSGDTHSRFSSIYALTEIARMNIYIYSKPVYIMTRFSPKWMRLLLSSHQLCAGAWCMSIIQSWEAIIRCLSFLRWLLHSNVFELLFSSQGHLSKLHYHLCSCCCEL